MHDGSFGGSSREGLRHVGLEAACAAGGIGGGEAHVVVGRDDVFEDFVVDAEGRRGFRELEALLEGQAQALDVLLEVFLVFVV